MGCGVGQKKGEHLVIAQCVKGCVNYKYFDLPPFSNKELQNLKNIIKYLAKNK